MKPVWIFRISEYFLSLFEYFCNLCPNSSDFALWFCSNTDFSFSPCPYHHWITIGPAHVRKTPRDECVWMMLMFIGRLTQTQSTDLNNAREQPVIEHTSLSAVPLTNVRLAERQWKNKKLFGKVCAWWVKKKKERKKASWILNSFLFVCL